jgi:hypothetical protein
VGFLVWLVAIALIQTLLYNGTNGSLLIACLFHAALNTTTTHVPGVPALLDIIVTWLVALLLIRINTAQKQNLPPQLFPPPRGIP